MACRLGSSQSLAAPSLDSPPPLVCEFLCPLRLSKFNASTKSLGIQSRAPNWHQGDQRPRPTWRPSIGIRASASSELPGLIRQMGQSLWGQGLPPGALVGAVRSAWTSGWMVMMKQLAPTDKRGAYQRPSSKFRSRLPNPVSASDYGRYHLYVSLTCPWAHRTAIVHALKGLGDAVPLSITVPSETGLWEFRPDQGALMEPHGLLPSVDRAHQQRRLMDVYKLRKGGYDGRATVPMLWDSVQREIISNESADIIEILNLDFNQFARNSELDLAPSHLLSEIEKWNSLIYPNINNGVYRCGFAQGQEAYNESVNTLFTTLDMLEEHLTSSRYLCGDHLTLADIRLFTTLFRFDPVYYVLFKCSKKKLVEFPNLYGYLCDIFQISGVAASCDLPAIMDGYYKVLFPLNPGGIRPIIPAASEPSLLFNAPRRKILSPTMKLSSTL